MNERRISQAELDYTTEENDDGCEVDCVVATCLESGDESGTIYGRHSASIKRALATLTEVCSCGAKFHVLAGGGS